MVWQFMVYYNTTDPRHVTWTGPNIGYPVEGQAHCRRRTKRSLPKALSQAINKMRPRMIKAGALDIATKDTMKQARAKMQSVQTCVEGLTTAQLPMYFAISARHWEASPTKLSGNNAVASTLYKPTLDSDLEGEKSSFSWILPSRSYGWRHMGLGLMFVLLCHTVKK
ncbi:hypothetical protein BDW72DRAFT_172454, partial [Aspergillus terricola var. indicus]